MMYGRTNAHRKVWKDYYGCLPIGREIHHKDGDPSNNAIDNLEALTPDEHREKHRHMPRRRVVMLTETGERLVVVRVDIPYSVRRKVRIYAANHDMNTNDAIVDMLNAAAEKEGEKWGRLSGVF